MSLLSIEDDAVLADDTQFEKPYGYHTCSP
jgi:hypothetical protein